jgi:hypothetical protein
MYDRALYYPYIHIQNADWLKATLLVFSQVRRMTPVPGRQPGDDDQIAPFTEYRAGREPLVTSANLWSARSEAAQIDLAERLCQDAQDPSFMKRFGKDATLAARKPNESGFQIHQAKLNDRLKDALRLNWLAWLPGNPEPYDPYCEYVELNPRVGQAVMTTLALACATGEGLDIVGDKRSGSLHECLTRRRAADIYDVWLRGETAFPEPLQASGQELLEYVIAFACDTRKIDVDMLVKMDSDREPIRRLLHELEKRAKDMAAMDPGEERGKKFRDETSDILKEWKRDRANTANFAKRFFGWGLLDPGAKFFDKVVDAAVKAAPAAGTGAGATGALAGLALANPLVAAGAGLAIGLFTHTAKTYGDIRAKERDSPYRYLTVMEKAGVIIRTDLREVSEIEDRGGLNANH